MGLKLFVHTSTKGCTTSTLSSFYHRYYLLVFHRFLHPRERNERWNHQHDQTVCLYQKDCINTQNIVLANFLSDPQYVVCV